MNEEILSRIANQQLIMDSQIQALREIAAYLLDAIGEFREELIQFRADRQICGRLNVLSLENEGNSLKNEGDKGPHDTEEQDLEKKLAGWH